MNIYTAPGHKVLFTGKGGYEIQKEYAKKFLIEGEEYTVLKLEVGSTSSEVFLEEVPGKSFNSVHFENIGEFTMVDANVYSTYTYYNP